MAIPSSFEELIRAYNDELRRYYAQGHPAPKAAEMEDVKEPEEPAVSETEPEPEAETESEVAETEIDAVDDIPEADEAADEPDPAPEPPTERPWESLSVDEWIEQILHPPVPASEPDERPDMPAPTAPSDENDEVGFLQVRTYSARGAVPLVDAVVSVIGHDTEGRETLLHMNRTDESGISPQVSLPAPDRALSLKPGDATPFLTYIVQVSAPGYATVRNEGVTIYSGVTSLQGVPMIPLPDPQADYAGAVVIRPGGAPPELN